MKLMGDWNLRRLLWIPLVILCVLHGSLMEKWMSHWGFFGAILHWFQTFGDPISAAAGVDLMALMIFVFAWMVYRDQGWTRAIFLSLVPYIVFPSIGILIYLMMSEKNLPGEKAREK
jgi:hypothetical protein